MQRHCFIPAGLVLLIAVVGSRADIAGTEVDIDLYPADAAFSAQYVPLKYRFIDLEPVESGAGLLNGSPAVHKWTDKERAIVREAFREWDAYICNTTTFVETTGDDFDISLDWAGAGLFKKYDGDGDYTNALGVWSGNPGDYQVPWNTKTYPLKEIYFNDQYFTEGFGKATWYIDDNPKTDEAFTGYDLLTVAKHEIGHALGIKGDYGQHPPAPAGKTADEVMWGVLPAGKRVHPQASDLADLIALNKYHVNVPEPTIPCLVGIGLGTVLMVRRWVN